MILVWSLSTEVAGLQILIVGAMVVGPEYNAIIGIALGIDQRTKAPVLRGAFALLAGFSAAVIVTLIFGLAIRWSGHTPRAYSLGVRPVSNLIDNPNLYSLIVAVLAGIVGVVSLTEARSAALIGVFISVTTIPAAADTGLSAAYANWVASGSAQSPDAPVPPRLAASGWSSTEHDPHRAGTTSHQDPVG